MQVEAARRVGLERDELFLMPMELTANAPAMVSLAHWCTSDGTIKSHGIVARNADMGSFYWEFRVDSPEAVESGPEEPSFDHATGCPQQGICRAAVESYRGAHQRSVAREKEATARAETYLKALSMIAEGALDAADIARGAIDGVADAEEATSGTDASLDHPAEEPVTEQNPGRTSYRVRGRNLVEAGLVAAYQTLADEIREMPVGPGRSGLNEVSGRISAAITDYRVYRGWTTPNEDK